METALLKSKEAAAILGVSDRSLATWRSTKDHGIPYIKIGSLVRYRRSDLIAYIEEQIVRK